MARGDGISANTLQTFLQVSGSRDLILQPVSGRVGIGLYGPVNKFEMLYASSGPGETDNAISLLHAGGGTKMIMGVVSGSRSYIQSFWAGTNWTGRHLSLQEVGGFVCIGSSNTPAKLLEINRNLATSTVGSGEALRIITDDGNTLGRVSEIGFGVGTTGGTYAPALIGAVVTSATGYNSKAVYFATRNGITDVAPTERMRIHADGNVSMGATSSVSRLHVYESSAGTGDSNGITVEQGSTGDATVQFLLSNVQRWNVGIDNSDSDRFKISTGTLGSSNQLVIDTNGNIGLGATPSGKLDLEASGAIYLDLNSTDNGSREIRFQNNGVSLGFLWHNGTYLGVGGGAAGNSLFVTSGNVGIGLSNPSYKLDVHGDARVTGSLYVGSSPSAAAMIITGSLTVTGSLYADRYYDRNDPSYYVDPATISRIGSVYAYDTEAFRLIDDAGYISFWNAAESVRIGYVQGIPSTALRIATEGAVDVQFYTAGNQKMVLSSGGKLGIGKNPNDSFFDVNGNASISGALATSGQISLVQTASINAILYLQGGTGNGSQIRFYRNANRATEIGQIFLDTNTYFDYTGSMYLRAGYGGADVMTLTSDRNVGIGTTTPAYKLEVSGSFAALSKSFLINHPTKPGMKLQHGVVEGPEHSVFVRGRTYDNCIALPEYWSELIDDTTITVQLTPIGKHQKLYVVDVSKYNIWIKNEEDFAIDCYYYVQAERKDIPKLQVELIE
jgi:hypothetical protein